MLEEDLYAFAAFFVIAVGFDTLERLAHRVPHAQRVVRHVKHAALIAPWFLHTGRDFAIHLLVYSHHAIVGG